MYFAANTLDQPQDDLRERGGLLEEQHANEKGKYGPCSSLLHITIEAVLVSSVPDVWPACPCVVFFAVRVPDTVPDRYKIIGITLETRPDFINKVPAPPFLCCKPSV